MDKATNFRRSKKHKRRNEANGPAVTNAERLIRSRDLKEDLLPGIRNDVTLCMITPNLSWSSFQILSSVSPTWQQAIESHLVYDTRVRTRSTETLAVVVKAKHPQEFSSSMAIYLFSKREKSWYELPEIRGLRYGVPFCFQCVSLDSKLNVLGGDEKSWGDGRKEVYVIDLAGERQWKQCASMHEPRRQFAAAVLNGKIYVFGGTDPLEPNCGCEVYDPKVNAWSWIKPMLSLYHGHQVSTLGAELLVHGGLTIDRHAFDEGLRSEVYHPTKDEWRLIKDFERNSPSKVIFSAQGKLLSLAERGIYVLDIGKLSWTLLQSCSFPAIGSRIWGIDSDPCLAVDDELLLLASFLRNGISYSTRLLRSRGFNQENKDVVWETITCAHHSEECSCLNTCYLLCSIQL